MLLKRDGFPFEETPANLKHIEFLRGMTDTVKGLSLNSNLYANQEEHAFDADVQEP